MNDFREWLEDNENMVVCVVIGLLFGCAIMAGMGVLFDSWAVIILGIISFVVVGLMAVWLLRVMSQEPSDPVAPDAFLSDPDDDDADDSGVVSPPAVTSSSARAVPSSDEEDDHEVVSKKPKLSSIVWILMATFVVTYFIGKLFSWWVAIPLSVLVIVIVAIALRYSFFALKENQGVILLFIGEFFGTLVCKKGRDVARNGDIVKAGAFANLFGGLRFRGLAPFFSEFEREWSWYKYVDGKAVSRGPEIVNRFKIDSYPYALLLVEVECGDKTRITAVLAFTGLAINLYKQWVRHNAWFDQLSVILLDEVADLFSLYSASEIQKKQGVLGEELLRQMTAKGLFGPVGTEGTIEDTFGVRLSNFKIVNVKVPKSAEEASQFEFRANAKALQVSTLNVGILQSIANAFGLTIDEVRAQFKANPEKFNKDYATFLGVGSTGARVELGEQAVRVDGGGGNVDAGLVAHKLIVSGGGGPGGNP